MSDILIVSTATSMQVYDPRTMMIKSTFSHGISDPGTSASVNHQQADGSGGKKALVKKLIFTCSASTGTFDMASVPVILSSYGPFLYIHSFAKEHALSKTVISTSSLSSSSSSSSSSGTSQQITSLAVTPDGLYYVAGMSGGMVSVWDGCTGELIRSLTTAHYKAVTSLCLLDGYEYLISSAEDGVIHVWSFGDLVDVCDFGRNSSSSGGGDKVNPLYSCVEHSKPISGLFPLAAGRRFLSYSLDKTCKLWDVITGRSILTFNLGTPVTAALINPQETLLFCGCEDGSVFRINIYPSVQLATTATIHIDSETASITMKRQAHTGAVTNLQLSMDASTLFSSGQDGKIVKTDVSTGQILSTTALGKGGAIEGMKLIPRPVNFMTPAAGDMVISCQPSKNLMSMTARIPTLINLSQERRRNEDIDISVNTYLSVVAPTGTAKKNDAEMNLEKENSDLKCENAKLKAMVVEANELNKKMYQQLVAEPVGK